MEQIGLFTKLFAYIGSIPGIGFYYYTKYSEFKNAILKITKDNEHLVKEIVKIVLQEQNSLKSKEKGL